ncbi:hypothetical protein EDD37DRAFT_605914 [Exophiala viscosa]|nr:hypothetical protein EDD37DRAFT_605914 [Exophiala viscosa]
MDASGQHNNSRNRVSKTRLTKARPRKQIRPHPPRESRPRHLYGIPKRDTKSSSSAKNATPTLGSGASTPESDVSNKLPTVKALLDKIWVRNKNQHRTQIWWKSLGMLRKAITTLVALNDEEQHLRQQTGTGAGSTMDAKQVRKLFEQESQIRRDREIWNEWIRETLLPRAYLGFSGLVADTQFAHLGVVLVGILADVMSVVGPPTAPKDDQKNTLQAESKSKPMSLKAISLRVTGPQSGEIVERMYDSDDLGEVVERTADAGEGTDDDTGAMIRRTDTPSHTDSNTLASGIQEPAGPVASHDDAGEDSSTSTAKPHAADAPPSRDTSKKPPPKPTSSKITKGKKQKGKKNAIDDLFAGLL